MIWFSKATLTANQIWHWNHSRRGRELMHSTLACHFYSILFPSHKSTDMLLGLYFNSFSASVHCFQQFKVQTEFCKGRAAFFSCAHPGGYTLLLETFFSWRVKTTENLRTENTKSTKGSNTVLLPPWAKVHQSQRMCFLLISGGFWSGLHPAAAKCTSTHWAVSRQSGTLSPTCLAGTSQCWWRPCL